MDNSAVNGFSDYEQLIGSIQAGIENLGLLENSKEKIKIEQKLFSLLLLKSLIAISTQISWNELVEKK